MPLTEDEREVVDKAIPSEVNLTQAKFAEILSPGIWERLLFEGLKPDHTLPLLTSELLFRIVHIEPNQDQVVDTLRQGRWRTVFNGFKSSDNGAYPSILCDEYLIYSWMASTMRVGKEITPGRNGFPEWNLALVEGLKGDMSLWNEMESRCEIPCWGKDFLPPPPKPFPPPLSDLDIALDKLKRLSHPEEEFINPDIDPNTGGPSVSYMVAEYQAKQPRTPEYYRGPPIGFLLYGKRPPGTLLTDGLNFRGEKIEEDDIALVKNLMN